MSNSLKPIAPPYSAEVDAILAQYPQRDGYVLRLFRVFANSVRFLRKGTVNLLDRDSPLTLRERELVILRTCANRGCEYEWGVHIGAFATAAALSGEQVTATTAPEVVDELWSPSEATLLRVVDALCAEGTLDKTLKTQFEKTWNTDQQLEIMALCGNYHTISFVANVSEVSGEDFAASFPRGPSLPG